MKAYELLAKGWCQNAMARDEDGFVVPINSPEADVFCSVGAVERCYYGPLSTEPAEEFERKLQQLQNLIGPDTVLWNDAPGQTQDAVVAAFKSLDI